MGWEVEVGAMLSRPSRDDSSCIDMLAAKACSPGRDRIQLLRGTLAFAASMARATTHFSEGRESMAPTGRQARHQLGRIFQIVGLGWEKGAMLSRPSGDESRCLDMLAAKACSPGQRQHPVAAWHACFRGQQGQGYYPLFRGPRKHATHQAFPKLPDR